MPASTRAIVVIFGNLCLASLGIEKRDHHALHESMNQIMVENSKTPMQDSTVVPAQALSLHEKEKVKFSGGENFAVFADANNEIGLRKTGSLPGWNIHD